MINKIIALFKKKPVPAKPMATRKPKCEIDEFEVILKDFSVEDWEELESINDEY